MNTEFYWVAVALTTIIAASRLTRLLTWDKFPPTLAIREWWGDHTRGNWQLLFFCGYCMSFWMTVFVVIAGLLCGVYEISPERDNAFLGWWIGAGIFAGSYLAAVFMAHDGDNGDED